LIELEKIPPENRVYLDESGIEKDLIREYGRALSNERVEDTRRGRKFQRLNVVAALCVKEVISPKCYSHAANGEFFETWVKDELLPEIKTGSTMIMDNASFHRKNQLYKIVEGTGIGILFLPAYSPDLNPIEKKWANMKGALPDLIPCYDSLESAVYSYLGVSSS
jgi:transposase